MSLSRSIFRVQRDIGCDLVPDRTDASSAYWSYSLHEVTMPQQRKKNLSININMHYERVYWARQLQVTQMDLRRAVEAVGSRIADIEKRLTRTFGSAKAPAPNVSRRDVATAFSEELATYLSLPTAAPRRRSKPAVRR
jgi:hypothetical protein